MYPFSWWAFDWNIINSAALNILYLSFGEHMYVFLLIRVPDEASVWEKMEGAGLSAAGEESCTIEAKNYSWGS